MKKQNNPYLRPFIPYLGNLLLLIIYLKLHNNLLENFQMTYEVPYFVTIKLIGVLFCIMTGGLIYLCSRYVKDNIYFLIFVLLVFFTVFGIVYFNNIIVSELVYIVLCIYIGIAIMPFIVRRKHQ